MSEPDEENPVTSVLEKYPGYFDKPDLVVPFTVDNEDDDIADENADFPESIKLVSAFRRNRLLQQGIKVEEEEKIPKSVEEGVKNLEFFDPSEAGNEEEGHRNSRLAINAVQMDLALKSFALSASRPMNAWLELFEKLKKWDCLSSDHKLVHRARDLALDIRNLYLEEYATGEKTTKYQFARDVNPMTDGCWIFVPIRRIINVIEDQQRVPNRDDLDIVRLTLLFSIWFLKKQDTLFEMFAVPSDVAVYIAEVFVLGPEIYADEEVSEMLHVWLDDYLIPKGLNQKLSFARNRPIAKLTEFQPFFTDLIEKYKEHGGGQRNFFRMIMVFAVMNSISMDGILALEHIFNPSAAVVRQVDISLKDMDPFINYTKKSRKNENFFINGDEYQECFEEYLKLLKFYTGIIINEDVTENRNPGVYFLAYTELNLFVDFWNSKDKPKSEAIDSFVNQLKDRIPGIGN